MDRRLTSDLFRNRLTQLHKRSGLRQSAFAAQLGIDRSALSQLMSGAGARLPRADTLVALAEVHQVSVDWLLGLSEDQSVMSETRDMLEIAGEADNAEQSPLAQWHEEALGSKIRYVPAALPDVLRDGPMAEFEDHATGAPRDGQDGIRQTYTRLSETDMEISMPLQRLEEFSKGQGVWAALPKRLRMEQLAHMQQQLDAYYPRLRLFLYDGADRFSMPYTIFGHQRVAIYAGEMYLLLNGRQTILTMVDHFDNLVRAACVEASGVSDFIEDLAKSVR